MESEARYGWGSNFPLFQRTEPREIRSRLEELIGDASPEQIRAWNESIPQLQREVGEIMSLNSLALSIPGRV